MKGHSDERDLHRGRGRNQDSRGGGFHNKNQDHFQKEKHWENDRFEESSGYKDDYRRDNRGNRGYRAERAGFNDRNDQGEYGQRRGDDSRRNPEKQNHYDRDQNQGRGGRDHDSHRENYEHHKGEFKRESEHPKQHNDFQSDGRRRVFDKPGERGHGDNHAYGRNDHGQHHRGNNFGNQGYNDHRKNFDHGEHGQPHQKYFDSRHHNNDKSNPAGAINVKNSEHPKDGYPQILKDLGADLKTNTKRFNKNSQEFSVNSLNQSTLTIPSIPGMTIPIALGGINQSASNMTALKEFDPLPNTNHYNHNSFNQTIYINSLGQQVNGAGEAITPVSPMQYFSPHAGMPTPQQQMMANAYGYGMPMMNQLVGNMMPGQMPPQMMTMMNAGYYGIPGMNQQIAYPAAMNMMNPQMMPMMQGCDYGFDGSGYVQDGYGQQDFNQDGFGQEMGDDPSDFISMLQMFSEGMQAVDDEDEPEQDDVDLLLEEAEFERLQEEADKLDEDSKDCNCCKGYPLKCRATICESLGMCHCRLRRSKEQEPANKELHFVEEKKNCSCCKGLIFACKGAACVNEGQCRCMVF